MFKVLQFLFYSIALLFIGSCVYLATIPSKHTYNYDINFDNVPKKMIQNQLIHFENWLNWAITDTSHLNINQNVDPLLSKLQIALPKENAFKIENELVLDSLVLQKVYTKKERGIQSLAWNLGKQKVVNGMSLTLEEELSFKDKIFDIFKWKNNKRIWLQHLHTRLPLLQQQLNKRASDYSITYSSKGTFGPFHYVYLSASGHVNNIANYTQKHITALEQYLAEHNVKSAHKPITIYNDYNETTGDLIFSTGIPIATQILIPSELAIRYGYIDSLSVYKMNIIGNPKSTKVLWETFKKTKQTTLSDMSKQRFEIYEIDQNSTDNYTKWKKQLVWGIKPTISSKNDSITYVSKNSSIN
ncbi:hypothetical protein [Aquimarina agarilytica]|uniref:hypothetical protein n=1 Tax=Aquimarina agarilytica TaxID=1087449 RepID=UPI000287ECC5|nr:hypothetical protein [Aquimarina agarilytica]